MEKVKRYLGILAALCLLAIGFAPVPKDLFSPLDRSEKITQLDGTILSAATIFNKRNPRDPDIFTLWKMSTAFFNTCDSLQVAAFRQHQSSTDCNGWWVFNVAGSAFEAQLSAVDPTYREMSERYQTLSSSENTSHSEAINGRISDPVSPAKTQEEKIGLERRMSATIAKFLIAEKPHLALQIYLVHAAWIGLFLLLVWQRALFGSLLCLPFTLVLGTSVKVAKAAKKVHEKV